MTNIKDIIAEISQISIATGAPDLTMPLVSLIGNVDNIIDVAVLGQFKSGKSSLINSIIGENLLPVGVVPVTAIVTRLRYGSQKKFIVQYTDGREIETSFEELPQYVTERLNPENARKVAQAIIEHPALEPFKDINLVDTPGLGSFYKHNSKTTQQWLPFIGVAMISVSAERPLSEEDIYLIKGIAQYCPEIAIIITKTDLFNSDERSEIKTYISESVKKAINRDIPMFLYSAYENPGECRNNVIEKLIAPLSQQSETKRDEITRHKTITILEQNLQYANLALKAALQQRCDNESVSTLLNEIKNNRHYSEREMLFTGTSFKGEVREKLEEIIFPNHRDMIERVVLQFSSDYSGWKGTLSSVTQQYEQWLKEKIGTETTRIDNACFEQINRIVKDYMGYYQYTALKFRNQLDEKLDQVFGVHLPEAFWQIDFTGIDKPDISIYSAFDSHLDMFLFFLPMKWFGRFFLNHFRKQIPLETDKNLHRYISGLTGKIIKTIDSTHKQALHYINNEIKTVENILQNKNDNSAELQKNMERLKRLLLNLNMN